MGVMVSELAVVRASQTRLARWGVVAGAGLAMFGHGVAVAAVWVAVRLYGAGSSDVDLDAGGRFAALVSVLLTFTVAHAILLLGILAACLFGPRQIRAGLVAGWGAGWTLIVGGVTWMILASA
ncbi:hypothetical protein ACIBXA_31770 [Micromonospora echinaurantiaca]|uniref:hypothetical protein n=1 Tax=Micromonospora echinaurantiaca TaxID=47857 RepID=UPI003799E550